MFILLFLIVPITFLFLIKKTKFNLLLISILFALPILGTYFISKYVQLYEENNLGVEFNFYYYSLFVIIIIYLCTFIKTTFNLIKRI